MKPDPTSMSTTQSRQCSRHPAEATRLPARFIYLNDEDDQPIFEDAFLTLYDSRGKQPNRSAEYRFYFPTTQVSAKRQLVGRSLPNKLDIAAK